jgi:hypothetical protein
MIDGATHVDRRDGGNCVLAIAAAARRRAAIASDLGRVTEPWLAEYRANHVDEL